MEDTESVQVLESVENLKREELDHVLLELQGKEGRSARRNTRRLLGLAHLAVRADDAADRTTGNVFEEDGEELGRLLHAYGTARQQILLAPAR